MNNPIDLIFQMFGGQQNFNNQFNQFQQNAQNQGINQSNAEQIARNLMNTGKMNQQQFEWCRKIANQITGKNY